MPEQTEYGNILTKAFERVLTDNYGAAVAPPAMITATGVRHLDALLGGGISSSLPVALSSTPETGKSTFAFQFAANFQKIHSNGVVVYLDIENAASTEHDRNNEDRISTFGIDLNRFMYKPVMLNVKEVFSLIADLIDMKKKFEQRTKSEMQVMIIWDSIASTGSSKDVSADNPNEIIGFKARELTFELSKIKPALAINQISFLVIDQVRSNLKIDGPFVRSEKTVGEFGNYKSATSITSLQHNIKQWLFLSRGKMLNQTDPLGVDGWVMHVFTEKNKLAPSNYWIDAVFDKKYGLIPILSEYYFLSNITKTEKKMYKNKKTPFTLPIVGSQYKTLEVVDPSTGEILYTSDKFRERKFLDIYKENNIFRHWFDRALEISIAERIINGYFRNTPVYQLNDNNLNLETDDVLETKTNDDNSIQSEEEIEEVTLESQTDTEEVKSEVVLEKKEQVGRTEVAY